MNTPRPMQPEMMTRAELDRWVRGEELNVPEPDEAHQAAQFPRPCSCCGVVILNLSAWRALPYKGKQPVPGWTVLEYRDCFCRSTLVIRRLHDAHTCRVIHELGNLIGTALLPAP